MNLLNKLVFLFFLSIPLLNFTSCSSIMDDMNKKMDNEGDEDKFKFYRKKGISSKDVNELPPPIKRNYANKNSQRRTAADLRDNSAEGSLWNGQGQDNYLFAKNRLRKAGDIVIIKVQNNLKTEISMELFRRFPPPKPKKDETKTENKEPPTAPGNATANQNESKKEDGKTFDSISGIIVEEINKDSFLVKGRKDVLFHGRKHQVEIQAMVPSREIKDDDSVLSEKFIESNVNILR